MVESVLCSESELRGRSLRVSPSRALAVGCPAPSRCSRARAEESWSLNLTEEEK